MDNVLNINNPHNQCTGCGACVIACPKKCINLQIDLESFFTPVINENICNSCGCCTQVCYKAFNIHKSDEGKQLEDCKVYSAIYRDTKELQSVSSGGVASELAKYCYQDDYDVIGVVMDPEKDYAEHIVANCISDLERMKSTKYVQSNIVNAFSKIRPNKKKLIIGLPCQIYGIRKYIQNVGIEEDFILVDLFCRGTSATNLFRKYRYYIKSQYGLGKLVNFNFRSKKIGWHKFSLVAHDKLGKEYSKTVYDDMFFSFYLKNTCFKECCYNCEFRHNRVFSDIRLGDFWGSKYFEHDEGVSLVSIYSKKGAEIWEKVSNTFIVEDNETLELKKSQRFNKFPIPEFRKDLLMALSSEESLESIHVRFGIDKMGFYKEKVK